MISRFIQALHYLHFRPLATTDEDKTAICEALENLIDECTLILGWCYSEDHVKKTKLEQRNLSRSALAKMQILCPENNQNSTVNHVPNEILNQLSENGRLVAVEIKEGNVGKATIYQRFGKEFTKKYLFDAYVPVFDGFKKTQNFNF